MKQLFAICGMAAALVCGAVSVSAQNNGGGGFGGNGGNGGPRNFDPAQFQQRMMDRIRDQLEFTNDADWSAVQPLVQKVFDARLALGNGGMGRGMMFGGRNRGGQNGDQNGGRQQRFGGMFGQPSPEFTALQDAINNNAPADQIKNLLQRFQASQKAKQDKLKSAQENLRAVLTVRQEAEASLIGLLD